jgi:hypothetical protein
VISVQSWSQNGLVCWSPIEKGQWYHSGSIGQARYFSHLLRCRSKSIGWASHCLSLRRSIPEIIFDLSQIYFVSKFKDRLASIYCRLMRSESSARCEPVAIRSSQIWHLGKRQGCLMPWAVFRMKLAKTSFLIEDRGRPAIIYMCLDNIHLPYVHISWFFLDYSFPSSYPFGSTSLE